MAIKIDNMQAILLKDPVVTTGISANNYEWRKCELVFETGEDTMIATAFNKVCQNIEDMDVKKGDELKLDISIKARKFKKRYYLDSFVERVEFVRSVHGKTEVTQDTPFFVNEDDDLPF